MCCKDGDPVLEALPAAPRRDDVTMQMRLVKWPAKVGDLGEIDYHLPIRRRSRN
jgi:hypothetical protein